MQTQQNTVKSYEDLLSENGSFFYKSRGVSMLPLIKEGRDFIYIEKRPEGRLKKYDVALFKRPQGGDRYVYVLHRVLKVNPDGTYWIIGDNCIGGETVKEENVIGVLTAVKRKGKLVTSSDFWYRLYVYLWCAPYPLRIFYLKHKHFPRHLAKRILQRLHLI